VVKKELTWKDALSNANKVLEAGNITRAEHLEIFRQFLYNGSMQDQKVAIALLNLYINNYQADFDTDLGLDRIADYGDKLCYSNYKEYGQYVIYPILKLRSIPATWIDQIADEYRVPVRKAFAFALSSMASDVEVSLDRTLGILEFFLDEPNGEVIDMLVDVFKAISKRDSERLHYYMVEFAVNAGISRKALFEAVEKELGKK
jgi:hypothetical protein